MPPPNPERIRKLRDDAQTAFQKHKFAEALTRLDELERLQPSDAEWPRRAAECHRALGAQHAQIDALGRAAERYIAGGFVVKAIAICKIILGLDPKHTRTQENLAELQARWLGSTRVEVAATAPSAVSHSPPAATVSSNSAGVTSAGETRRTGQKRLTLEEVLRKRRAAELKHPAPPVEPERVAPSVVQEPPPPVPSLPPADEPSRLAPHKPPSLPQLSVPPLASTLPNTRVVRHPSGRPSGMHHIVLDEEPLSAREPEPEQPAENPALRLGLFAELTPQSLNQLIARARLLRVDEGTTIVQQGDPSEALYVIVSGAVTLVADGERSSEMTSLGSNDFFGESSLITNQPEPASAEAIEATELLVIDRHIVEDLLENEPHTLQVLLRSVRERLVEQFLLANHLFTAFTPSERRNLARRFQFFEIQPGSVLIEQGGHAMGLFLLLLGRLQIMHWEGETAEQIGELCEGRALGNISLLTREPSFAEVFSPERAFALMLPEQDLCELIMTHPQLLEFVSTLGQEFSRRPEATQNSAPPRVARG